MMKKNKSIRCFYFDREGKPLVTASHGTKAWFKQMSKVERLLCDIKYKVIEQTELSWGGVVSTVWLGIDYSLGISKKPIIFETALFAPSGSTEIAQIIENLRYTSIGEAREGHAYFIKKWRRPPPSIQKKLSHGKT